MNSGKEKMGNRRVDRGWKTGEFPAIDELDVALHQKRKPFWWRPNMDTTDLAPPNLNARASQCVFIFIIDARLFSDHPVHGEYILEQKLFAAGAETVSNPELDLALVGCQQLLLAQVDGAELGIHGFSGICRRRFQALGPTPCRRNNAIISCLLQCFYGCNVREQAWDIQAKTEFEFWPI